MSRPTASGAKEQVGRLLALVPYLHAKGAGSVRLDEAARDLGVPERTLVKDLRVLFLCGLPGGYPDDLIDVDIDALVDPDGDRVIRVSNADYLARPLRLTPTEATAVIVALRALRSGAVSDDTREVIDRALAKLEHAAAEGAAGAETAARVDPGEDVLDPELARLRTTLERAVADRRQVRLRYWVPSRDEESERVVDPRGVVTHQGVDYLDAWCHSAEAPRSFRLDRIGALEVLDAPITTAPQAPRSLADGFFAQGDDVQVVTLRLAPEARWVTEYYAPIAVRPLDDGRVEVELHVADPRWLVRLLLRLAPYATVVSHPEFTETFAASAAQALKLYDADA
ncbi:helix-turn-helix transcriptional regulator [Nocardioides sp. DS6]|uniref:Helix-turn-helix transcriptional regulator n=1 Tax=Nocardioides eburneus TaxID=3231482 RepID=A0ABV3SVW8_9ACTN